MENKITRSFQKDENFKDSNNSHLTTTSTEICILSIQEVADLLGKKPQTIRNWVAMRKIPFIPGRPAKFLFPSVMKWLESQEVQPWQ